MTEKIDTNLEVINGKRVMRDNEVSVKVDSSRQTNPIVRKLLDFSSANKTDKFSVLDLFKR